MAQEQCNTKGNTIIQINEQQIKEHLGEIVRGTVQETLNALLDEEASRLCNACLIRSIRTPNPVLSERLFSNPFPAVSTL